MKFFKVILNTVGKDNEKVLFIIPPAEETDESGNPAYDEDFLLSNAEYKSYLKETKAAVVAMLIYGSSLKKGGNEPSESESDTSYLLVDTNSTISETVETTSSVESETSEESSTVPAATAETSSETETTTPTSSTTFEPSITTTATELTYTLTFDTNGGLY